jgi:N-acetylmuramoyl-L-alanine amidase
VIARRRTQSRLRVARVLAFSALFALLALPALGERMVRISVIYPEPRPPEQIQPTSIGGASYVSTNDLARVFSATKYWRPEIQKLTLRIGDHTVRFTIGAPLVLVDENAYNLVMPPRLIQGVVYVPQSVVEKIFDWGLFNDATWDDTANAIRFRTPVHTIRQAQIFPHDRVTEISATLLHGLPPRVLYATPNELRLFFEGGTLDTMRTFVGGVVTDGWIREVPGGVDLRLRLSPDARGYAVSSGSGRLKVSLTDDKDLVGAGVFNALEPVALNGADKGQPTIVIDPGHGGEDQGAPLPGGLNEKDAALDLARALRAALAHDLGARIILTRDGDTPASASHRAEIANSTGADLFVSIHLASEGSIKGGGFRVLTMTPLSAGGENSSESVPEEIDGMPLRPWLQVQSQVVGGSIALAQAVADSLQHAFPQTPVIMDSGRVRVLEPIQCPAIMLESAPVPRGGADAANRGYTVYDYTRTVASAIEQFVKAARG